jgi:hypothetical protein
MMRPNDLRQHRLGLECKDRCSTASSKELRPSDKLTPNPRSGSGGFDFTNHTPRPRSRRSHSRAARLSHQLRNLALAVFMQHWRPRLKRPRQRRQVTPALNPTCRQKPARLRPGDEPGAAPSFGLPTANSLRSMVDSRAKRPRQVRRGRSRQRYRRACTRRLLYLFRGGARPASGYETADTRTRRCASLQYRECNLSCFRIVANR